MRTRTKIICTLGPAVNSYEKILELIEAGMNVARLNFSHGTQEDHLRVIQMLKKARKEKKAPLAIMLDTKGPEIRVGVIKGDSITLPQGHKLILTKEAIIGDEKHVSVTPSIVIDSLKKGMTILFDDGYLIAKVLKKSSQWALVEIQNTGVLKTHKSMNLPEAHVDVPALSEQDIEDIIFGVSQDIDLIAASFIRSKEHILEIKKLLKKQKKQDTLVIAKIESSLGVTHFEEILEVADGIMVARGDLGVELPLKQVPSLQKMMIRKCAEKGKPVIIATQMLESMIQNPRPTRAEVSDVANAIYDSASCVMLSGETASGKYPIEALKMMKSIVEEAEKDFGYRDFFDHSIRIDYHNISTAVSLAAIKIAYSLEAKALFAFTILADTARLIARFRPKMPLYVLTQDEKTYHQLAFSWGVIPLEPLSLASGENRFEEAKKRAKDHQKIKKGDVVVVIEGNYLGKPGITNTVRVENI